MLTNRLIVSAYVARNLKLWTLTRLVISAVLLSAKTNPLRLSPITIIGIALCCAIVSVIEIYRRHEFDLLGNLGVGSLAIGALALGPPLFGELLLHAIIAIVA